METATGETRVVRHEEELHVGKRETERGRLRIRKFVETEPVTEQVELRRETIDVQRQPADSETSEGELGEQDIEITLHEEEPVIGKKTVAKERVTIRPKVETRRETVRGEVSKERIEVEGGDSDQSGYEHDHEHEHSKHDREHGDRS